MQDKTLKLYRGKQMIREYLQISPLYKSVCQFHGIPQVNQAPRVPRLAILQNCISEVRMSSFWQGNDNYKAYKLNSIEAWIASGSTCNIPEKDYLQVEFKKIETVVAIDLQGRVSNSQWVTKIKLATSQDGKIFSFAFNGQQFDGNIDTTTIKTIQIPPISTKYLRIIPTGYKGHKCCRFDVRILP